MIHVSYTNFSFQAKVQLHLKRDESIVDVSYCLSNNLKLQCFWLLDTKNQIWKCTNENDPNSYNWSLQKVQILNTLLFRRFMQPAMTFDRYLDTSSLFELDCLKELLLDNEVKIQVLFAFNQSCTSAVMVKQPWTQQTNDYDT